MADYWNLGDGIIPHSGNWQVRGQPNPDQVGQGLEKLWFGPMAQEPYRSTSAVDEMESVIQRWVEFCPEMSSIRLPFNINCWGTYGTQYHDPTTFYLASYEAFITACNLQGMPIHWVLMDGPSQRADDAGDGDPYPTNKTETNVLAWCEYLTQRQVLSHQTLLDWCLNNPTIAPEAWAFECINEPDVYFRVGRDLGDQLRAYAIYAQHNVNIWQQVYANAPAQFDNAWIFVGGFNYSARFEGLAAEPNPHLPGNVSAIQYIRDNIPASRLSWSMHAYPQWIGGETRGDYRRKLRARMGGINPEGVEVDRLMFTEINVRHDQVFTYPWTGDGYNNYINHKMSQWYAAMGMGISWWTAANYAQARLIQIQNGFAGVRIDEGWSYAAFHYAASYNNNDLYFGPNSEQNGERPPKVDSNIQRWVSWSLGTDWRTEFDARGLIGSNGEVLGIGRQVRGHGGRGTCVLQGNPGSANNLYGGDGWNVLYGGNSQCMDYLAMGRGGGVARSTHALGAIFIGSTHSLSRFYLSPNKNYVSLFDNDTNPSQIIIDPSSDWNSLIEGFNPNRDGQGGGDRFSLRGAFANPQELRDSITIEIPGNTGQFTGSKREDVLINLPGGGIIRFVDGIDLLRTLPNYCLDFTEGWYQPGWEEPADYDPADLDIPAPPADSFDYAPLTFMDEAGGGVDPGPGGPVTVKNHRGETIMIQTRTGNQVPVSD